MKKVFVIAMFLLSFGAFSPETAQAQTKSSTQLSEKKIKIYITIGGEIGRRSRNCAGFGLSCIEIGGGFEVELRQQSLNPSFELSVPNSLQLNMTFLSMGTGFEEATDVFYVDSDTNVSKEIASKLGLAEDKTLVIKAGEYKTTKNAEGKVVALVNYQVL